MTVDSCTSNDGMLKNTCGISQGYYTLIGIPKYENLTKPIVPYLSDLAELQSLRFRHEDNLAIPIEARELAAQQG